MVPVLETVIVAKIISFLVSGRITNLKNLKSLIIWKNLNISDTIILMPFDFPIATF